MLCSSVTIAGGDTVHIEINAEPIEITVNSGDTFLLSLWDSRYSVGKTYIISDVLPLLDEYITTITTDNQGFAETPLQFTNSGTATLDKEIQAKEDALTGGLKSNIVLVHIKPVGVVPPPPPPTPGFTMSADKLKGTLPYDATITISKSSYTANETVDLVRSSWPGWKCFHKNIPLINGKATVMVSVAEEMTLMCVSGYLCCDVYDSVTCANSNELQFASDEWGWETYAIIGVVVLGAAYVLGKSMERKK